MKRELAKKLWLGGALSGAATGASTGALFGGVGAPIGAVVGFIGGGIAANRSKQRMRDQATEQERKRQEHLGIQRSQFAQQQDQFNRIGELRLEQENKTKRFQLAHDQDIEEQQSKIDLESDRSYFRDYAGGKGRGFGTKGFYQKGGNMELARPDVLGVRQDPSRGGHIDNTASNAGIVRGRSHETGGVQLPQAEVEGGESIVQSPFTGETQVHSDSLGISKHTNELIERKGQLEEKLQRLQDKIEVVNFDLNSETTTIRRNSYKRQHEALMVESEQYQNEIAEIDAEVEQLYQTQEGMKEGNPEQPIMKHGGRYSLGGGIKPANIQPSISGTNLHSSNPLDSLWKGFKSGIGDVDWKGASGKFGAVAGLAAPFIDNVYNMHLTSKLRGMDVPAPPRFDYTPYGDPIQHPDPIIQKPLMDKATYLDPTHDVSDKLAGIERHTAGTTRNIMGDVSDSRVGRALAMDVGLQGTHMKGQVATEKINQERVGRNLNRQIAQEVSMRNTDRTNQYNMMNLQRLDRVGMANVELLNAYARGDIDMINQYNMMNMQADYQHKMTQYEKDIQTDITMPSQNVAKIRDEIIGLLDRRDMRSFQDKQLALQALIAKNEGTFRRNILPQLDSDTIKRLRETLGETEYNRLFGN